MEIVPQRTIACKPLYATKATDAIIGTMACFFVLHFSINTEYL